MSCIQLCNIDSCTQCNSCVNICPQRCIRMVDALDGFRIPEIDYEKCTSCGLCIRSCHKLKPTAITFQIPLKTYACWTKNSSDRNNSSSGGAFSVLAHQILRNNGVVFGASMTPGLKVRHIAIESTDRLALLQGSKYVQSDLSDCFRDVRSFLNANRSVLFSGTPCQIAGLLQFLKKPYPNLYTCDVVCHGVPSQEAFDIYLHKIGLADKCSDFYFRFTEGWGFCLSYQKAGADNHSKTVVSPKLCYYLKAFNKGLMFDEACYSCPYARPERVSDFTMGDYWGLGKSEPFHHPTRHGVSCLLVNNDKALSFLNQCQDLWREERPLQEAIEGNHNLSHPSLRPQGRDSYYEDSISMPIDKLCAKYGIGANIRDYLRQIKQRLLK